MSYRVVGKGVTEEGTLHRRAGREGESHAASWRRMFRKEGPACAKALGHWQPRCL